MIKAYLLRNDEVHRFHQQGRGHQHAQALAGGAPRSGKEVHEHHEHGCCCCHDHLQAEDIDDFDDDLIFLYCPKCHKRVTVAEEPKNGIIDVKCCGEKMVNLDEVQSYTGYVFECKKCGIKISVEEDCSCFTDDKEHGFT